MTESSADALAGRLAAAQEALLAALDGVTDAELRTPPSDGEWTIAQVCAHVIEMQPLWAGKAARILDTPEVGRTPDEAEQRVVEIERHAGDDIDAILDRLADSGAEALEILNGMENAQLNALDGTGSFTGRSVVERYIISHIEEHAAQIREARSTLSAQN